MRRRTMQRLWNVDGMIYASDVADTWWRDDRGLSMDQMMGAIVSLAIGSVH